MLQTTLQNALLVDASFNRTGSVKILGWSVQLAGNVAPLLPVIFSLITCN